MFRITTVLISGLLATTSAVAQNESWRPGTEAWREQQQLNEWRIQNRMLREQQLNESTRRYNQQFYQQQQQPLSPTINPFEVDDLR